MRIVLLVFGAALLSLTLLFELLVIAFISATHCGLGVGAPVALGGAVVWAVATDLMFQAICQLNELEKR